MGKKLPINRMNMFYSESDFELDNDLSREFVEGDLNVTVVLFQVDRTSGAITDDVYGESSAEDIKFIPPKEINVKLTTLEEATSESYAEGFLRKHEYGNLTFNVFVDHLEELGIDIRYGDYIGYNDFEDNVKYFTVVNDGRIFSDNKHTRLGYKGYYRTIIATQADEGEFNPEY